MKIRYVQIQGFRGIKSLEWKVNSSLICLIGPGNSCKTTILDAISLALAPRWGASFTDSDFFDCTTADPLSIAVTVGELPDDLLDENNKFGRFLRGWSAEDGLVDEPSDSIESVLTIQLRVDESLDPTWTVVADRYPEGKPISSHDRELLGAFQLGGSYLDRELSWSRNSVLTRFTSNNRETSAVLSRLHRSLRQSQENSDLAELNAAAQKAQQSSARFGVKPKDEFRPFLDTQTYGNISLHDGTIPVRQNGIGDRRLLTIALQHTGIKEGGILLIDEIEQGLEPHRLRNLIRLLRPVDNQTGQSTGGTTCGQTFLTTHSPITISELSYPELYAVRRENNGCISVETVPESIVKHIKKTPEALLAKKVIVCEGNTEYGLCQILDRPPLNSGESFLAYLGVVPVIPTDGGGRTNSPKVAEAFRTLGYAVAYFGDADEPLNPSEEQLKSLGIEVVLWANDYKTEQRVFFDLPWVGVLELCEEVIKLRGSTQSVIDTVVSVNNLSERSSSTNLEQWLGQFSQDEARQYLVKVAASAKPWFKSIEMSEKLARIVLKHVSAVPASDLSIKLNKLKSWAHELPL